jgi:glycosyltransferase involved in cell wall biosynthesis
MSKSQLTVILPVRNGEKFLAAAIASVLKQTFKEFELWVLENGSEDKTAQVVRSVKDSRIKLFELGPVGVQGALQYAIENARTDWLARMDADDLMFPNRLETQWDFIKRNPGVTFVGTAFGLLTPFGHIFEPMLTSGTREVTKELMAYNHRFFGDPTIVFNRHAAVRAGGADFDFPKVDGVPLLFRLLTQGRGWEIGKHLHLYRVRPASLSRGNEHIEQAYQVRLKYAPELFKAESKTMPEQNFWRFIANLELLSKDVKSIRRAFHHMKQEGPWGTSERLLLLRNLMAQLAFWHYRRRDRRRYRYRRDWEESFRSLLDLEQGDLPITCRESSESDIRLASGKQ